MTPVPKVRTPAGPGGRLVSGRLLNRIAEAIQARTPLNAKEASGTGFRGATKESGTQARRMESAAQFEPGRTYVIGAGFVEKLKKDLRARTPTDGQVRRAPALAGSAAGMRELVAALEWITPDVTDAESPDGYRMPVAPPRYAKVIIEIEIKTIYAGICCLAANYDTQQYIVRQITTSNFEHGTTTFTTTASGAIRAWQPGGAPEECAAPTNDNTRDPDFDYGGYTGGDYTEDGVPFSDVREAAMTALEAMSWDDAVPATLVEHRWEQAEWREKTVAASWVDDLIAVIGCGSDAGVGVVSAEYVGPVAAYSFRWRVRNVGEAHVKLFWTRHRLPETGPGHEDDPPPEPLAEGEIAVERREVSDWQYPPTASSDPAERLMVTLARVQLGPYR